MSLNAADAAARSEWENKKRAKNKPSVIRFCITHLQRLGNEKFQDPHMQISRHSAKNKIQNKFFPNPLGNFYFLILKIFIFGR